MSNTPEMERHWLGSSAQNFHSKTFDFDDKFDYFAAILAPPCKRQSDDQAAVLRNDELKMVEEAAVTHALKEFQVEPFARIGSEKDGKTRRFLLLRGNEDLLHADINGEVADKVYRRVKARNDLKNTKLSAVVTVWEGRGFPPDVLDGKTSDHKTSTEILRSTKWERSWLPAGHSSRLRYRWVKVELYGHDPHWTESELLNDRFQAQADALEKVKPKQDRSNLHMFAMHVELTNSTVSMMQILKQARDTSNTTTANRSKEVIQAITKKEFAQDDKDLAIVHANKFYKLGENFTKSLQGLDLVSGSQRTLRMNANDQPILLEEQCMKLFFPKKTSVAHFIEKYYGLPQATEADAFHETLSKVLNGKLVVINTSYGHEERAVLSVSKEAPAATIEDQRHTTWRSKAVTTLQHPSLPCLNVGSPMNPILIPPEMCVFKPMQSFRGPHTIQLNRDLQMARENLLVQDSLPTEAKANLGNTLLIAKQPKEDAEKLDEQLKHAFNNFGPNILFVEAGVKEFSSAAWKMFRKAMIKNKILKKNNMEVEDIAPLFLQYQPGANHDDIWSRQLRAFLKCNENEKKTTTLVVALQPDQHENHIYKCIKRLCDVEVGVQTFFINLANVEAKIRKFGVDGPEKSTNEIIARMRMRNSPAPPSKLNGRNDITVAYHITETTQQVRTLGQCGDANESTVVRYLVTFSARDSSKSQDYHTKVVLKGPAEMLKYDPSEDLMEVLKKPLAEKAEGCHVTILRSGYMPPTPQTEPRYDQSRRHSDSVEPIDMFSNELMCTEPAHFKGDMADGVRCGPKTDNKASLANSELTRITHLVKNAYGPGSKVSYVLLAEDDDLSLSLQSKQQIEKEITAHTGDHTPNALLFLADTRFQSNLNGVSAHRSVAVKSGTKLVALTLLGDRLSLSEDGFDPADDGKHPVAAKSRDQTPLKSAPRTFSGEPTPFDELSPNSRKGSPLSGEPLKSAGNGYHDDTPTKRKSSAGSGRDAGKPKGSPVELPKHLVNVSRKTSGRSPSSVVIPERVKDGIEKQTQTEQHKPSGVSKHELKRLADLWSDDRLRLFDTKWPVPTHLAHLATKRAQLHLRLDGWDNNDDAAPCVLQKVHRNVENTLYFL